MKMIFGMIHETYIYAAAWHEYKTINGCHHTEERAEEVNLHLRSAKRNEL